MHQKKRLSLAVSAALGLTSLVMAPNFAMAQDQDASAIESDDLLEEVMVTGSRLRTVDGFGMTSPVTVVGMDDIKSLGLTRVEDILNSLPQIETAQNSFISNGASGTASIDLRGLGSNRTLVLINGRRMQPGGVGSEAPDVNQIPASMIERIEVLTGGASATYGSDAVAGVVNFILRRVNGVELSVGGSGYQHDNSNKYIQGLMDARGFEYPTGSSGIDGKAYNVDLVMGSDFADGRGNATVYATWRKGTELLQASRDYSSCALSNAGTGCGGSANAIVPNFFIAPLLGPGDIDYDNQGFFSLQPDSGFAPYDGSNIYNYAPVNHFMRPDERWSAGANVDFEINEHATPYMEISYAHNETRAQIAESGTFFAESYELPLSNSTFSPGFRQSLIDTFPGTDMFSIYIGKRNTEGGPRTNILTHDSFRIVGGIKGAINDNWDYDVSYLNAHTASVSTYIGDFFAPKIRTAVNGDACAEDASCIPYEVFTYQGVTPAMAAGLQGTAIIQNTTNTKIFNAFVTGNLGFGLPAGDITVVGGVEWRDQFYENISDTLFEEGSLLGQGGPTPSIKGGYSVKEIFGEADIPLLSDAPAAQALSLGLAYRYSDYSTLGSTSTYRAGIDWQIVDMFRIRTGYNRAVRAPGINELFSSQSLGLWAGQDLCSNEIGETPVYTAAQCANTGVSSSQYGNISPSPASQYNGFFGGNPNLDVETADTLTFGVVVNATDTMQFSVDYWDIKIQDTIGGISPEVTIEQCALYGTLCGNIQRAGNGSLWQGDQGFVVATQINLGEQHWEGIDVAWNWGLDTGVGNFDFDFLGTYMLTKETTPLPDVPTSTYDCVGLVNGSCFASPEWRHVASVGYDMNSWWSVTARWRFYDTVKYDGSTDVIANTGIGLSAQSYLDLNASFRFMENHDVTIGVNNVLDEEPPMVGGTLASNANTVAGFYDTLGRYLYGNVTLRW